MQLKLHFCIIPGFILFSCALPCFGASEKVKLDILLKASSGITKLNLQGECGKTQTVIQSKYRFEFTPEILQAETQELSMHAGMRKSLGPMFLVKTKVFARLQKNTKSKLELLMSPEVKVQNETSATLSELTQDSERIEITVKPHLKTLLAP